MSKLDVPVTVNDFNVAKIEFDLSNQQVLVDIVFGSSGEDGSFMPIFSAREVFSLDKFLVPLEKESILFDRLVSIIEDNIYEGWKKRIVPGKTVS